MCSSEDAATFRYDIYKLLLKTLVRAILQAVIAARPLSHTQSCSQSVLKIAFDFLFCNFCK